MSKLVDKLKQLNKSTTKISETSESANSIPEDSTKPGGLPNNLKFAMLTFLKRHRIRLAITTCALIAFNLVLSFFTKQTPQPTNLSKDTNANQVNEQLAVPEELKHLYFENGLALKLIEDKKLEEALGRFEQLVLQYPENSDLYINLSMAYKLNNDLARSEKALRKAILLDPENSVAYNNLAMLLLEQNNFKVSALYLQKSIELNPEISETLLNFATYYETSKKFDQAIKFYQLFLQTPRADKSLFEQINKRLPRLSSLQAQQNRSEGL